MNEVLTRLGLNEINGGAWAGAQISIADANAEVIESVNPSTGQSSSQGSVGWRW